jgi:hypothetical protein
VNLVERTDGSGFDIYCEFPGCGALIQEGDQVMVKALSSDPPEGTGEKVMYHAHHFGEHV